ncbi:MAG: hypothetical protein QW215_08835 [Ignisphaera sp.]|uniref:Uncharacterized protein n=1 Tax=Ignisphaera aggregans TaxID=334771 RepID=A0A7C4H543_9CREN
MSSCRKCENSTCKGSCIKGKSFDEIKKKAEFLEQIWNRLKEELRPPEAEFTFLYRNEYAPLIGTICDERVKTEYAWRFPEWLNSKLGGITLEKIIELGEKGVREYLEEYFKNKWPNRMKKKDREDYLDSISRYIVEAMNFLKKRGVTPITMFENREYKATEVYFMLRQFNGIGPKKAKMITKYFLFTSMDILKNYPWFNQIKAKNPEFKVLGVIMPPIDVHVVKVFCRIFGEDLRKRNWNKAKNDPDLIQDIEAFSQLAFPDIPMIIDEIFWNIGRKYCDEEKPKCQECPLNKICDVYKKI